jgi:hypothetical protein
VLRSGKICLGRTAIPCTIRNVSDGGACLEVQTTYGIPATFELATADETARSCKVRWLDGRRMGVEYQASGAAA